MRQERPDALVAHRKALRRREATDLALDGEQGIDALQRLDGDRRLVEPRKVEEVAPRVRPAGGLGDWRGLAPRVIEPVEPSIGRPPASIRHSQPDAVRDVWRCDRPSRRGSPPADRSLQRAGRRVHSSIAAPCGSFLWQGPALSCRRRGCARPRTDGRPFRRDAKVLRWLARTARCSSIDLANSAGPPRIGPGQS
jgi:hypothetical protein